jgi:hypothetical protein
LPGGYYLSSLALGSQEILGQPVFLLPGSPGLTATYRKNAGTIRGACGGGQIVLAAEMPISPSTPGLGRVIPCDLDGSFRIESLQPADYMLWALGSMSSLRTSDPDFLPALMPSATVAHVEEDATVETNLKVVSYR